MTESFYIALLNSMNPTEKHAFYSCLEKHKFRIHGFRSLKDVPYQMLTPLLVRYESNVVHALKDLGGEYTSSEDALAEFTKGNVTKSFSYLLTDESITEEQLVEIINSSSTINPLTNVENAEKEIEELKTKCTEAKNQYQATRKDYLANKKELNVANKENKRLQEDLTAAEETIIQLSTDIQKFEEKCASQAIEIEQIRKQNQELTKENKELRTLNQEAAKAPTLVLLRERISIPHNWVLVRTYDFIASLDNDNVCDYSEILYVYNEMPNSLKIKIRRIEEAQKRVKTFTTNHELRQYIKEARQ